MDNRGRNLALGLAAAGVGSAAIVGTIGALGFVAIKAMARKRFNLAGKVALITGGSRGLGLQLAREFGGRGMRVAICARDAEELQAAQRDLEQRGISALAIPCDLTDAAAVEQMVAKVNSHFGTIDVLVNNAGVIAVGPSEVMTREDYEYSLNVHFWAAFNTVAAVLPAMRRRGAGRIVNISSIGGKISVPHLLPYCAGKFALTGFSEGLRSAVKRDGIYVTTICPGLMRTGSPRNADFKSKHRLEYAWFAVSDSLPGLAMSVERAARRIVRACEIGEAEVVLSLPAKLAVRFHGLFPGTTANVLDLVNRALPDAGGIGERYAKGRDSESLLTRNPLTALTRRAERTQNELQEPA
jgi:NAD(P)-dependent dehydrogenase (short-subunit alcohol dehydrogenase family)